ncbi:FxDxF family PEP-CTERM protein [Roseateles sp. PN1]|uniref:FxDxF family PEP-CTERM protein n=1 Tax=Roseateles sp. PN1 TaxID=3137372 RepID=UPI0031388EC2
MKLVIATVFAASSLLATAASAAASPIALTWEDGVGVASFIGNSTGQNVFSLDLSALGNVNDLYINVYSSFAKKTGFDISSVTLGDQVFTPLRNDDGSKRPSGFDNFEFSALNVKPGQYTLTIFGTSLGGSFGGNINVSGSPLTGPAIPAIPEPSTYALLLAGIGAVALVARRRKSDF